MTFGAGVIVGVFIAAAVFFVAIPIFMDDDG